MYMTGMAAMAAYFFASHLDDLFEPVSESWSTWVTMMACVFLWPFALGFVFAGAEKVHTESLQTMNNNQLKLHTQLRSIQNQIHSQNQGYDNDH